MRAWRTTAAAQPQARYRLADQAQRHPTRGRGMVGGRTEDAQHRLPIPSGRVRWLPARRSAPSQKPFTTSIGCLRGRSVEARLHDQEARNGPTTAWPDSDGGALAIASILRTMRGGQVLRRQPARWKTWSSPIAATRRRPSGSQRCIRKADPRRPRCGERGRGSGRFLSWLCVSRPRGSQASRAIVSRRPVLAGRQHRG